MTRFERRAAIAVAAAAAGVVYAGVTLAARRARYLASLAASKFRDDDIQDEPDDSDQEEDLSGDGTFQKDACGKEES